MALALVQSTAKNASGSLAYGSNNAAGNLLILIGVSNAGIGTSVPTDTQGNTWNLAVSRSTQAMFYAMNSKAGANTVTDNSGANAFSVYEWSGAATTSALDATGSAGSGSFPFTLAPSTNNQLVIVAEYAADNSPAFHPPTPQAGFTTAQEYQYTDSFPRDIAAQDAYQIQTTATSVSVLKWSTTANLGTQSGVGATFKAAPPLVPTGFNMPPFFLRSR